MSALVAQRSPGWLRSRALSERRVVAVAAAVGAAFAPAAPTGCAALDLLLRASIAAAAVLVGARAPQIAYAPAAVAAGIVATGSAGQGWGHAAAGMALAVLLTVHRSPIAAAAVVALCVQAAFRLDFTSPHGAATALGTLLLAPAVVTGWQRAPSTHRRQWFRASLGATAAVAVAGGVAVGSGYFSRTNLERGIDASRRGIDEARAGDADAARRSFAEAANGFSSAERSVSSAWSLPGRLVPVVAQHHRLLGTIATSGRRLAETAVAAGTAADVERLTVVDGKLDIPTLRRLDDTLTRTVVAAEDAEHALAGADSRWILTPIAKRLDTELNRLRTARRDATVARDAVRVVSTMGGGAGPRRYFLAIQTPSEARAAGGFIGNFGELTADDGELELVKIGRTRDLNAAGTPQQRELAAPPDFVARYRRFDPAITWQNVTMSPDFPTVAKVVGGLYPQSGGQVVDGVIGIDPIALSRLLKLTGPITAKPWPTPITADNAERILLFDQYAALDTEARVDFLGEVARAVWTRLTTGSLPPPKVLVDTLGPVVKGRHLMVASVHEREARLLESLHMSGGMPPVDGDFLGVVTQNATGSKLEWFLRRHIAYRARVDEATGRTEGELTVTLRNEAPAGGLPPGVIGNILQPPLPSGTNRLFVSVYTPLAALDATVGGQRVSFESERELDRRVFSLFLDIPPGGETVLVFRLAGEVDVGDGYALDVFRQPLVAADQLEVNVPGAGGGLVFDGPLESDLRVGG